MYERYHVCNRCLNRRVSVHTVYGQRYEGVVVGVDPRNVYLDTASGYGGAAISAKKAKTSAFGLGFGGFGAFGGFRGRNTILTLALFDLLAIALI